MSEHAVRVTILGRDYPISCPPEEQSSLLDAGRFLDDKMREIKAGGNVVGLEKIAVMAALNITHELLQGDTKNHSDEAQLKRLADKISHALGGQSQLQL